MGPRAANSSGQPRTLDSPGLGPSNCGSFGTLVAFLSVRNEIMAVNVTEHEDRESNGFMIPFGGI